jgi:hypothetical protein
MYLYLRCLFPSQHICPRWLYALFLAIDANFRLQRNKVSSDVKDPGLNAGWAYFVDETLYKTHLASYGDQAEQVSTTKKTYIFNYLSSFYRLAHVLTTML